MKQLLAKSQNNISSRHTFLLSMTRIVNTIEIWKFSSGFELHWNWLVFPEQIRKAKAYAPELHHQLSFVRENFVSLLARWLLNPCATCSQLIRSADRVLYNKKKRLKPPHVTFCSTEKVDIINYPTHFIVPLVHTVFGAFWFYHLIIIVYNNP